ncbi:diphthine--ammonia ligase [Chitinophaga parva]|uniref:Diphthine--ammonia ligase n=2 Tax=Chitinophaga parva TaxID=2169414 RepID=A0A2T7BMF0_9BACT|nr:diphthine--ammonia ligase [Chitinophaga parva]
MLNSVIITHMKKKALMNWSSGKDAAYALWQVLQAGSHQVDFLFTTLSAAYRRVSMHGLSEALLDAQAARVGIPLRKAWLPEQAGLEDYNAIMGQEMAFMRDQGISTSIFGDIFLEDLKQYRERQLEQVGMEGVFPLWKRDSRALVEAMIADGFKAVVVCVNADLLPAHFTGRVIDAAFLADLPEGVDPCGENGEFHSFVVDGPLFSSPVPYRVGQVEERSYGEQHRFFFRELLLGE